MHKTSKVRENNKQNKKLSYLNLLKWSKLQIFMCNNSRNFAFVSTSLCFAENAALDDVCFSQDVYPPDLTIAVVAVQK